MFLQLLNENTKKNLIKREIFARFFLARSTCILTAYKYDDKRGEKKRTRERNDKISIALKTLKSFALFDASRNTRNKISLFYYSLSLATVM